MADPAGTGHGPRDAAMLSDAGAAGFAPAPLSPEQQLALLRASQLAQRNANDWEVMGEAFEGLCKTGLALTVGFSVAAAFCKMMDQKKADIPSLINRVAGGLFLSPTPRPSKDGDSTP
jgi:hypothetical protein